MENSWLGDRRQGAAKALKGVFKEIDQSCHIFEIENSQVAIFRDWFLACHQNIIYIVQVSLKKLTYGLTCSQIWRGPLVNDGQQKNKKKTTYPGRQDAKICQKKKHCSQSVVLKNKIGRIFVSWPQKEVELFSLEKKWAHVTTSCTRGIFFYEFAIFRQ